MCLATGSFTRARAVASMQALLRQWDLPRSGRKAELWQRIARAARSSCPVPRNRCVNLTSSRVNPRPKPVLPPGGQARPHAQQLASTAAPDWGPAPVSGLSTTSSTAGRDPTCASAYHVTRMPFDCVMSKERGEAKGHARESSGGSSFHQLQQGNGSFSFHQLQLLVPTRQCLPMLARIFAAY